MAIGIEAGLAEGAEEIGAGVEVGVKALREEALGGWALEWGRGFVFYERDSELEEVQRHGRPPDSP